MCFSLTFQSLNRPLRYSSPLSFSSTHCEEIQGRGTHHATAIEQLSLRKCEDDPQRIKGLPTPNDLTRHYTIASRSADRKDAEMLSGTPGCDSESTNSNSEYEEDSDDDIDGDDNDWSGANDYIEATILQAVFPDLELAAHLITGLYSMLYPGSSKSISNKVSSWRERVRAGTTDSGTTSTEKAPTSNTTANTARRDKPNLNRPSGSTDRSIDDEEDEEEDDADESRRKKPKENSLDRNHTIPAQKLACPFFKQDPSKFCAQFNQEGQDDRYYRPCAGPGFKTIQLLK